MKFVKFFKKFFYKSQVDEQNVPEEEDASFSNQTSETIDPLIPSAIKVTNCNRSEISISKPFDVNCTINPVRTDPLQITMSASMSGIGVLEDSNESEMAENLVVSDNEGKWLLLFLHVLSDFGCLHRRNRGTCF